MMTIKEHCSGRILLLKWHGPLDGSDPAHVAVATHALNHGERFLLLDMTHASYADSDALRWLFRLRDRAESSGKRLRTVASQGGKVWRNLVLLAAGLEVYASVRQAWTAPWLRGAEFPRSVQASVRKAQKKNRSHPDGAERRQAVVSREAAMLFGFRQPPPLA